MARKNILQALLSLSGLTALSRVFGLCRDIICANIFGAGAQFDAFLVAFQIPNFMRRLFAEGAFSQAFVPLYSGLNTGEQALLQRQLFVANVMGGLSLILGLLTVLVWLFAPQVIKLYAPGFMHSGEANRLILAATLLRWTFPYLLCISLTACIASILNSHGRFWAGGMMPILLNVCLIVAAVLSMVFYASDIVVMAKGVLLAGVLQLVSIYWIARRRGLVAGISLSWRQPVVHQLIKLMSLGLLGAVIGQISLMVDTFLASMLRIGSVSWLYYSQRLVYLPVGVFAVAISTVIMPILSKASRDDEQGCYHHTLRWSIQLIWMISLPATVGLLQLAYPIVMVLFQHGSFSIYEANMTYLSLVAMTFGLPAFMFIKVIGAGFYAKKDMKTPIRIALWSLLVNVICSVILMRFFQHVGIALATAVAAWAQVYWLNRKMRGLKLIAELDFLSPFLSTAMMALVLHITLPERMYWLHCSIWMGAMRLLLEVMLGIVVYELCLKILELSLFNLIRTPPKAEYL